MPKEVTIVPYSFANDEVEETVPRHLHTCPGEGVSHTWRCPSPYCQSLKRTCPVHGGEVPKL